MEVIISVTWTWRESNPRPKDVLTEQFTYAIDNYLSFTPKAKRLEIIKLKKTCGIHPLNAATLGPNVISTNLFFSELEINKTLRQNQTLKVQLSGNCIFFCVYI